MKLKAIEEDLYKKGVFGRFVAHLRVIEFQKRDLPHAHILIILDERDRINTAEQVVSAGLPPHPSSIFDDDEGNQRARRDQLKKLRDTVCKWMIHGPCGGEKPKAPCMYNNNGDQTTICSKNFPKQLEDDTFTDQSKSYVRYRRRAPGNGEHEALVNDRHVTNAWVVPYSPYLAL